MINLKAVAVSYTRTIYVIFDENDYIDKYELYRNDVLINTYAKDDLHFNHQEEDGELIRPCVFDRDHHTNLFFKNSNHEWMYKDTDLDSFQEYKYCIKCYHNDAEIDSKIAYATLK